MTLSPRLGLAQILQSQKPGFLRKIRRKALNLWFRTQDKRILQKH
jgi:hypothetical protein